MISAGTFDILFAFLFFAICNEISMSQQVQNVTGVYQNLGKVVGVVLAQYFIGAVIGLALSVIAWPFKYLTNSYALTIKALFLTVVSCALIVGGTLSNQINAMITVGIAFAYGCGLFWKDKVPTVEMGWVWFFAQVFLFAPAGAALILSQVNKGDIGFCFVIIICGVLIRMLAVFLATIQTDFNFKEKLLIAIGWCSKGSLPALLGSVIYA